MISADELAQIQRDTSFAVCDKTCIIKRKATTRDTYGSESETFNTIATVSCGMSQPSGGQLQNYDFIIGSLEAWQVHFPIGTNVQHQDHLMFEGLSLVVQVLLDVHSYPALLTVLASEIR